MSDKPSLFDSLGLSRRSFQSSGTIQETKTGKVGWVEKKVVEGPALPSQRPEPVAAAPPRARPPVDEVVFVERATESVSEGGRIGVGPPRGDTRPLWERLRENEETRQREKEETMALRPAANLDEDDVSFLDEVQRQRVQRKRDEEVEDRKAGRVFKDEVEEERREREAKRKAEDIANPSVLAAPGLDASPVAPVQEATTTFRRRKAPKRQRCDPKPAGEDAADGGLVGY
eukprot:Hpha_TRINITY_DN26509_c0_g1::TRINITY_DN26509_c0_g1_i1::g.113014::m.113014